MPRSPELRRASVISRSTIIFERNSIINDRGSLLPRSNNFTTMSLPENGLSSGLSDCGVCSSDCACEF